MEGKSNKTFAIKARLLAALFVVIICASCNKDEDYRDNFIGKYNCAVIFESFCLPDDYSVYSWCDTLTVTMVGDSSICISFTDEDTLEETVSAGGYFGYKGYHSKFGTFEGNNIYLTIEDGGLGGSYTIKYYGKKFKK